MLYSSIYIYLHAAFIIAPQHSLPIIIFIVAIIWQSDVMHLILATSSYPARLYPGDSYYIIYKKNVDDISRPKAGLGRPSRPSRPTGQAIWHPAIQHPAIWQLQSRQSLANTKEPEGF